MTDLSGTLYDMKPNPKKRYFKVETTIICDICRRTIKGLIVLDRLHLKVIDTKGFLFFDEPVCDKCSTRDRQRFAKVMTEICKESTGHTPEELGIDVDT